MQKELVKIGFGGGCHWCTEAIFQSLKGVIKVEQGFIAQEDGDSSFSEAVLVNYDTKQISLKDLMEVHLHTHKSTSAHSMRTKYRSAVYVYNSDTHDVASEYLKELQLDFKDELITEVHYFKEFKYSEVQFHNYFYTNPEKPFCKTYISPKLKFLMQKFSSHVDLKKSVFISE